MFSLAASRRYSYNLGAFHPLTDLKYNPRRPLAFPEISGVDKEVAPFHVLAVSTIAVAKLEGILFDLKSIYFKS